MRGFISYTVFIRTILKEHRTWNSIKNNSNLRTNCRWDHSKYDSFFKISTMQQSKYKNFNALNQSKAVFVEFCQSSSPINVHWTVKVNPHSIPTGKAQKILSWLIEQHHHHHHHHHHYYYCYYYYYCCCYYHYFILFNIQTFVIILILYGLWHCLLL